MNYNGIAARSVLVKMFDIEEKDIVFMKSRIKNKVKARRFYNYYLWRYKRIKHYHMDRYIIGIHHSSSLYNCRFMERELDVNKKIRKQFITFMWYADPIEWEKMKIDMAYSIEELTDIDFKKKYIDSINLKQKK